MKSISCFKNDVFSVMPKLRPAGYIRPNAVWLMEPTCAQCITEPQEIAYIESEQFLEGFGGGGRRVACVSNVHPPRLKNTTHDGCI